MEKERGYKFLRSFFLYTLLAGNSSQLSPSLNRKAPITGPAACKGMQIPIYF